MAATATKEPKTDRPTHVTVEARLSTDQAAALSVALARLEGLLENNVMSDGATKAGPAFDRREAINAVGIVRKRLGEAAGE